MKSFKSSSKLVLLAGLITASALMSVGVDFLTHEQENRLQAEAKVLVVNSKK